MSALTLTGGTFALCPGNSTQVLGVGGAGSYQYFVLPGGAGGTIDRTTGRYTAPHFLSGEPDTMSDTVQVRDAQGAEAHKTMLVGSALMLLCDIIQMEMGLEAGQVYIYNQKIDIPTDSKLYIAVGIETCKPYTNMLIPSGAGTGLHSIQQTNFMATCSVDILSRGVQARDRKEEVIMALQSIYAQSQQETNGFYVAKLSTAFVNLSQVDGAAIPYRFNISINLQYAVRKVKSVPYFNTFSGPTVTSEP